MTQAPASPESVIESVRVTVESSQGTCVGVRLWTIEWTDPDGTPDQVSFAGCPCDIDFLAERLAAPITSFPLLQVWIPTVRPDRRPRALVYVLVIPHNGAP